MSKQRGKRTDVKKKKHGIKLRVACHGTSLRRDINKCAQQKQNIEQKIEIQRLPCSINRTVIPTSIAQYSGFFMFADGFLLWRLMSFSLCENTARDSPKIRKSASWCPFFLFERIYFLSNSALTPSDWLTGASSIHQRCAQSKSLLQPWGRQAGGARGKRAARRATAFPVCHRGGTLWPRLFWRAELPAVSGFQLEKLNPERCCCLLFAPESLLEIKLHLKKDMLSLIWFVFIIYEKLCVPG